MKTMRGIAFDVRMALGKDPVRNALFALFLGGILAWGAAFAWYMLSRFDLVNLLRDVNEDDAFYYFQIAWHMSRGEFSTFDGGLTRTNGYHPLWLFLITPFYWFFDKVEALYALKAFELMLVAGGAALIAGAARVARLPWILLFAALPMLYQQRGLFAGMETAAALFLLGLFVLAICLYARDPARWRWLLAAVAFALPWVRLEYVAIAMAATAALCLIEWLDRRPSALVPGTAPASGLSTHPPRRSGRSVPGLAAAAPFLAAVAGLLVYFAYNGIVFGSIVPVSGATKQWWSERNWEREGGYSLTGNVREFLRLDVFDDELLVALEICAYVLLVWWLSRRSRGGEDRLLLAFLVGVFGLAAGHLAKFVQSVLTVHPQFGEHYWYFAPAYLMLALVVPVRCYVAIWLIRRFFGPGPHPGSNVSRMAIFMIGAVWLFAKADFTAPFRSVHWSANATYREWAITPYMGTMVMDRVLPEDSVVGSWGSGIIGYFSRFPVMNLDGLANSWDYLAAQKEGTSAEFRRRHGITHLANFEKVAYLKDHDTMLFEGPVSRMKRGGQQFKLWFEERLRTSRAGIGRSEWFRERMEPHLERGTEGVGLLVEGRMAHAFAWDCAPNEVAVWTWGQAGRGGTVFLPWTRTSIGFCTSAIVLPHDASPPVQAAAMTAGEYLAGRLGERRPVIDSDFDVYLVEKRLVYVKEPCGQENVAAPIFLHVDPVVPDDLPGLRKWYGFDNLDFRFDVRGDGPGVRVDGTCLVEATLPDYRIAAIRTGQSMAAEGGARRLWEGEIRPGAD